MVEVLSVPSVRRENRTSVLSVEVEGDESSSCGQVRGKGIHKGAVIPRAWRQLHSQQRHQEFAGPPKRQE